jgi:hypothetical protein
MIWDFLSGKEWGREGRGKYLNGASKEEDVCPKVPRLVQTTRDFSRSLPHLKHLTAWQI